MRLEGRVWKSGRQWLAEVPLLDLMTQGRSQKDAMAMMQDAIISLVDKKGFTADIFPGTKGSFEVASNSSSQLVALLLRRQRAARGLSLADAAQQLEQTSRNSYARYEQGKAVPTIDKLSELLNALNSDFVLRPSATGSLAHGRSKKRAPLFP